MEDSWEIVEDAVEVENSSGTAMRTAMVSPEAKEVLSGTPLGARAEVKEVLSGLQFVREVLLPHFR